VLTNFIVMILLQMIGFLKPSSGTAYIQGMNILTEMDRIYACMGVCPQHEYVKNSLVFKFIFLSFTAYIS
jgi:ABC-type multidrug transport system ATPase subunit